MEHLDVVAVRVLLICFPQLRFRIHPNPNLDLIIHYSNYEIATKIKMKKVRVTSSLFTQTLLISESEYFFNPK